MYKKALNSFFLKVHPDLFAANAKVQRVNEAAIAQLNELLGWAKEYKNGTLRPPPATTLTFTFYRRPEEDGSAAEGSSFARRRREAQHPGDSVDVAPITTSFNLPENFAPSDANRGVVERSVSKFLRDLLRRAECIDSVEDGISAAADATAERVEAKPLRRRAGPHRREVKRPKSLLDEAVESISEQWSLTATPTMDELMDADQILFSKDLSPLQTASALHTLRRHIGELHYERWESMPLIISNEFVLGEVAGTLTVPWDFTPEQMLAFLYHNEAAIARCRSDSVRFAQRIEQLVAELCGELELDDILISCSHKDAMVTLQLLHRNKELLRAHGLTHLSLEIGLKYATRANGVVIIRHDLTGEQLRPFLAHIAPRLELQRKLYRIAKSTLEATMWHLKQFRDVVEPAGIDAFDNDCTYAERLQWAKELFRIGSSLAQWDWTEFTVVLGPVDIDWSKRIISLPHNFDGDSFVRYVEEVHRDAKQQKRDELLRESAQQRIAAANVLDRQRRAELLEDSHADGLEGGRDGAAEGAVGPTRAPEGAEAARERRRAFLREASPHMEEYMSSSKDRVDSLSVERPLTHAVTFNSDEEADDQLRWEGFYQEPYVDQMPRGDLDDVEHTYLLTNRWHREAAAKKVVEQLKSTYGSKGRKFDYMKMGDVLEINNAKVQPKGFPTLTRGLKPGM